MTVSTTSGVVADTCRLSVDSATRRVDLAVPVHVTVAELLTVVVTGLGSQATDQGVGEGGWVLQRTGEQPLRPTDTLTTSGVVDGDVLHLRTRATQWRAAVFDDVVDAVATGIRTRTRRWRPAHTSWCVTAAAGGLLAFTALVALTAGPRWTASSITLAAGALALGLAARHLSRTPNRAGPALTAAGGAVVWAAGCGATAFGGHRRLLDFGGPQLLGAQGAALLAAVVLLATAARGVAGLVTVAASALLGAAATGAAVVLDLHPAAAAAVLASTGLASAPAVPALSFRLARLPLSLVVDDTDAGGRRALNRAGRADQVLTGLVGGVSLSIAGASALLAGQGIVGPLLAAVLGSVCLLRSRLFTGLGQRILLLTSGGVGLAAAGVAAACAVAGTTRVLACAVPAGLVGVALLALSSTLPGRRWAPPLIRAAELAEALLVLAAVPLILWVLGVYGAARP